MIGIGVVIIVTDGDSKKCLRKEPWRGSSLSAEYNRG